MMHKEWDFSFVHVQSSYIQDFRIRVLKNFSLFSSMDHKRQASYRCRQALYFCKITCLIYYKIIVLCWFFLKIFDPMAFLVPG